MADLFQRCRDYTITDDAKALGVYPYFLPIAEHTDGSEVVIDGKKRLMLGSNNYLGLTFHPKVKEAARAAMEKYGTSCSGSRFLNGTLVLHDELEERLAAFLGKEDSAVISTGYQTNLATLGALFQRDDVAVLDQQNHASLYEGVMISRCRIKRYEHLDMEDADRVLGAVRADKSACIITDGVFSMEGDIAPLPQLIELKKKYGVKLMVDDAHGLGTMGPTGRGTCEHFGVTEENWWDAVEQDAGFAESESPLYVGRAIAALAADPEVRSKAGGVYSSWGLAREYGFVDGDGRKPHWDEHLDARVAAILAADTPSADDRMLLAVRLPQLDFDPGRADERAQIAEFLQRQ